MTPLQLFSVLAIGSNLVGCSQVDDVPESHLFRGATMGTTFSVQVVGRLDEVRLAKLKSGIERSLMQVDAAMSTYREDSEVTLFNRWRTTDPFSVTRDTLMVFQVAVEMSELTGGAFDVTIGGLVDAWGFGPSGKPPGIPTKNDLDRLVGQVGYRKLEIDPSALTIRKLDPLLSVDLSAIAKGFAVDRVSDLLQAEDLVGHLVEVGGEVRTFGYNGRHTPWRVGIERPSPGFPSVYRRLALIDHALATSGDYRNYYEIGDTRISHTIDPRTGRPVTHSLASASVIAPTCIQADAMATALAVLGPKEGYALAVEHAWAALLVGRYDDGTLFDRETTAFKELTALH